MNPTAAFTRHCQVVRPVIPQPSRRFYPAGMVLACAFPPSMGYNGACTTIADLSRHGLYPSNVGFTPNKQSAVRLIVDASMEATEAHGHGNEAARRAYQQAVEAEQLTEGRCWPLRPSPHDD